jgi:hypothetical protein
MSSKPPRRRRLFTYLKLAVLLTAIAVGGSVAYQAANPNAGMLNCPVGHFKIGILCIDRGCGLVFLFELLAWAVLLALVSLICGLMNEDRDAARRSCHNMVENIAYAILSLLLAAFAIFCPTWP